MKGVTMDEREMTSGVIPLRHASLPGHVKLPRRYEKAAMGSNGIPLRVRKISIQPGSGVLGDSLSDRLHDLTSAILWVKQELIMLRQHDILLKRQFFDIQHSIQSLQKTRSTSTPTSPSAISPTLQVLANGLTTTNTATTTSKTTTSPPSQPHMNGDASPKEVNGTLEDISKNGWLDNGDFPLETFVVRPSSSVTMLHEQSEDDEEEETDTFCEELFFRPRTSSMRTSRDMAALARRRGSKELI